jgi:YbbR domain-containing protein
MDLLPGILARNWQLKLAAFAIALLLWIVVRLDSANRQSIPAQVQIENTDPDWALVGEPLPGSVEVLFGGPAGEILRVAVEGTSVRVPIDVVARPDTSIGLRSEWVAVDRLSGLVVQDIRPASVRLHFEPIETRDRPLGVRTRGSLDRSLALTQPLSVMPATVRLRGPESRVSGIDTIYVESLDLGTIQESGNVVLPVSRAALSDMMVSVDSATVRVQLEPSSERVLVLPIVGHDGSVEMDTETLEVRIFGPRSRVDELDAEALRAVVRLEEMAVLEPGEEGRLRVRLEGVPGLIEAVLLQDSVTVRRASEP